jgi:hypothetical protein
LLIGHITKKGELVNLSTHFLPDAAKAADAGTPKRRAAQNAPALSAAEAIVSAAKDVGSDLALNQVSELSLAEGAIKRQRFNAAPVLKGEIFAELVWLPTSDSAMRLAGRFCSPVANATRCSKVSSMLKRVKSWCAKI